MSDTPQHVLDFNAANGAERYGGLHFDDPAYGQEQTSSKTEHYTAEVKQSEAKTPEHADLAIWLLKQTWSDFAQSLATFYADRGYLTEKQVASATSMRTKVEARETERVIDKSEDGVDLTELPAGYYAVPGGDTRLKVVVNKPTSGRWDGYTFVHDGAEYGTRTKYGMQAPDGTYRGKIEDQLRTIVADPQAAGRAYAAITTRCYRCNRKLEDETSVELGIGPICRS